MRDHERVHGHTGRAPTRMKYLAIYERTATSCSVYVPDLPSCITTAPSLEEATSLIQEAVDFHLKGLREDGPETWILITGES